MVLNRLLAWCCTFFVMATPAWAATDAAAMAESLMRKSGLWEQLADVARGVRAGMVAGTGQGARKPSPTELERLSRAIDTAYSAQRLRSACLAAITSELDPKHVPALRSWYDGPIGKSIAKLEESSSRQDSQETLVQGNALLRAMPSSRRRTLDEILLATRAAELAAEMAISTAVATQQGAAGVVPNAPAASAGELKAVLERQRQQLTRTYSAILLASFAATYSSLPTSDLAAYVEFLKSDAGRHFNAVGMRAISAAMLKAAADFGRTLPGARDKANT
jgi:hypothetical protein